MPFNSSLSAIKKLSLWSRFLLEKLSVPLLFKISILLIHNQNHCFRLGLANRRHCRCPRPQQTAATVAAPGHDKPLHCNPLYSLQIHFTTTLQSTFNKEVFRHRQTQQMYIKHRVVATFTDLIRSSSTH